MTNAHVMITAGLMSPKDWIGLAIDIEQFRKQEQGTQVAPGDFLEQWLSVPIEPKTVKEEVAVKVKRGRKPKAK